MNTKLHILVISPFYPPYHSGGYELRCRDIMHELESRGHDIRIISSQIDQTIHGKSQKENEIYRVLHFKSQARSVAHQVINDLNDMRFIRRMIRGYRPDLVYLSHMGDLSNAIIPHLSSLHLPFLYDEGGIGLMRSFQIMERGLYFYDNSKDNRLKILGKKIITSLIGILSCGLIKTHQAWPANMHIMANSHATMQYAIAHGVPDKNYQVIHSGIDLQKFPFTTRQDINDKITILVPGRIVPIKNTKDAVYLLKELLASDLTVELLLVGKVGDDVYFKDIQWLVDKLGLAHSIRFISMIDQESLAKLYQNSDFCFFPSQQEFGLSRVPLEAMASGALVISYGGESSGEIIQHEKTGLLIEQGDIVGVASWIVKLTRSREQPLEIIGNARQEIEKKYSLSSYVDAVESYLKFIMESGQ